MESNREEILKSLAKEWGILPQQENEFTVKELIKTIGSLGYEGSDGHITRQIKKCVSAGIVQLRSIKSHKGGGHQNAFSPADGKTWEDVLQYLKDK